MNSMDGPDYALTQALVDEHTSRIDAYPRYITPDFANVNGHRYAKRSPGLSILGIPAYVVARGFSRLAVEPYAGNHPGVDSASAVECLSLIFPALCGAATVMLLFLIALRATRSRVAALIASVSLGLGTLLWKYSHSYQRMPLELLLFALVFYLLMGFRPVRATWRYAVLLGVVIGYTVVTETSTVFVLAVFVVWFAFLVARARIPMAKRRFLAGSFCAGVAACLVILAAYDLLSFGRFVGNLYVLAPRESWMTYSALFSTPLFPSVFVNLFNNGPVPLDSISTVLTKNPVLFWQESANWAIKTHYDGLFVQSPYLVLAVVGCVFFFRKFPLWAIAALAVALVTLISMSKFVEFFTPNQFDNRLFLPMALFLSIGLAFWWRAIWMLPSRGFRYVVALATGYVVLMSAYNGWYSELTDYGPHVTGNHRFDPTQLQGQPFAPNHLGTLFVNTFPNIFNLWYLLVWAGIAVFFYLAWEETKYWLARWPGLPRRVDLSSGVEQE